VCIHTFFGYHCHYYITLIRSREANKDFRLILHKCKNVMLRQHEVLPHELDHCSGIIPYRPLCLSLTPCNAGHSKTRCCSSPSLSELPCRRSFEHFELSLSLINDNLQQEFETKTRVGHTSPAYVMHLEQLHHTFNCHHPAF